jgi:hypothetical protein
MADNGSESFSASHFLIAAGFAAGEGVTTIVVNRPYSP